MIHRAARIQLVLQQPGDALADRQPQAQAALAPVERLLVAVELVVDLPHVVFGDAGSGVPDLQRDVVAAYPHADHDAAFARIAQRVGQEVLQYPAQQAAVAAYRYRACVHAQLQATPCGDGRVLRGQFAQQFADIEVADLGVQATGVQTRDVQQAVEQFLGRAQRGVHAFAQVLAFLCLCIVALFAVAQCADEQTRRVQRLQHVVADRGQEARARLLRVLRGLTAFGHALFQRFVGLQQQGFGALEVGDVVVAGDVAAAGQRLAAHLDHLPVRAHALEDMR